MHVIGNWVDAMYSYVVRQDAIQPIHKIVACRLLGLPFPNRRSWERVYYIEVRHHHGRMNTSICTPGTRHRHLSTQQCGQGLLQDTLHAHAVGLYLPTAIGCTVIG